MAAKTAFDRFVGSVSSGRNWRYRPTLMVAYSVRFIFIGLIFVATYREPGGTRKQQKIMPPKVKASVIPPSQTINERGDRTTG
ncbi:MAG: hypothetical protein WAM88_06305 [Nitrososphaeraceae archaeon]